MKTKIAFRLVVIFAVGLACCGCGNDAARLATIKQQVAALESDAAVAREVAAQLRGQAQALDAVIEALPDGPDKDKALAIREQVATALDKVQAFLDKAAPAITAMNEQVQAAGDSLTAIEAVGKTAAGFAPAPWNMVASGLIGLAIGLVRAWRNKKTAKAVIASVQPLVDAAIEAKPEVAKDLTIAQGVAGKKLVDAAQGRGGLALPV